MQKMKHLVVALWAAAWMGCGAEGGIDVPLRLHCGACGRACASAAACVNGASGCSSSSTPSALSRGRSMPA